MYLPALNRGFLSEEKSVPCKCPQATGNLKNVLRSQGHKFESRRVARKSNSQHFLHYEDIFPC
jgi:hypothetical protein